jgi:myo-inositol 2-dehydrogenase/D-chiro-inositol 1-dehydrogenase
MSQNQPLKGNDLSRRSFVKTSTAAAGVLAAGLPSFVHAAEDNVLKIGLIGCGGRGTGAAAQALGADKNTKLIALADMFKDKLDEKLSVLMQTPVAGQIDVKPEMQFVGWDGYKGVIEACDVVLLATPPHFRPMHLKAVAEAGKHCFCEKPVATDAPSLRSVMETTKIFKEKNKTLVSGLCYRYDTPKVEMMKRIHDGALGTIINLQGHYLTTGLWSNARKGGWSDMEFQLRNWLYYTWLSGDMIVEQHIHTLDKMLWTMGDEPPVKVIASGGRTCRTAPIYGNVYDHFASVYEWANGVKCFAHARQWDGCASDVSDTIYGTEGTADLMKGTITGKNKSRQRPGANMYDLEHQAMYKAIRANETINNGDYMCKSTGMAIMGRMSAYTGQPIKWEEMLNSQEDLKPAKYEFGPIPVPPIAVPGQTKFA